MDVSEFVSKWRKVELTERSASQQHFLDLCELFDHPKPQRTIQPAKASLSRRALPSMAVFAAYGWDASLSDEEILARLLELNRERAAAEPKKEREEQ